MADATPRRGDVWRVDLEPVRGHERGRARPAAVISANVFDQGPSRLVVICPMTTRDRRIPLRVPVAPPEGGLRVQSYIICEQVRTISTERLASRLGELSEPTMSEIEERLRILLDL